MAVFKPYKELDSPWDESGYFVGYKKWFWSEARSNGRGKILSRSVAYNHILKINLWFTVITLEWTSDA